MTGLYNPLYGLNRLLPPRKRTSAAVRVTQLGCSRRLSSSLSASIERGTTGYNSENDHPKHAAEICALRRGAHRITPLLELLDCVRQFSYHPALGHAINRADSDSTIIQGQKATFLEKLESFALHARMFGPSGGV